MLGLTAIEFFVFSIGVFILLYWILPEKMNWVSMIAVVLLLSVLAYNFTPNESDDVSRYWFEIDYMRERGHDEIDRMIEVNLYDLGTYRACLYYFYFISKLPNNHYLPAITIFLIYGLVLLCMYKAIKRFNVNRLYAFLGILFFLSTYWYYDALSGIRNALSFAIAFASAYFSLVERKNILLCYVGYVIAAYTHSAGIMLVVLAIFTEITLNTSGKFVNFLFIVGAALGTPAASFLAERTDNKFINSIAGKAEDNAVGDINVFGVNTGFQVNLTVLIVTVFIFFCINSYLLSNDSVNRISLKRFHKYVSFSLFFVAGTVGSVLVFYRLTRFVLPVICGLMFMIGFQLQEDMAVEEEMSLSASYTPIKDTMRYKIKTPVILVFTIYTAVHFWYLCSGSSLAWIHF